MKRLFSLLLIVFLGACSKTDEQPSAPSLSENPEASVIYDTSNYGIYKGVLVGPSGIARVNINNDGKINAVLTLNGTRYLFTTTESVLLHQAINGLTFTSGNMHFDFNCNAQGDQIEVTDLVIPGYSKVSMILMKEYSDTQVKCYQGTFAGQTDQGVFNLMASGDLIYGLSHSSTDDIIRYIQGTRKGTSITGTLENYIFSGGIFGNSANGAWQDHNHQTGNWTAQRTL